MPGKQQNPDAELFFRSAVSESRRRQLVSVLAVVAPLPQLPHGEALSRIPVKVVRFHYGVVAALTEVLGRPAMDAL